MKTIELTDEDYETLMELSKELQTQTNNGQAFPYFWTPSSMKNEINYHGEGNDIKVYLDGETYTLEDIAEKDDFETYLQFLIEETSDDELSIDDISYDIDLENEWLNYIESNDLGEIITFDLERVNEENPSLFLSDVKDFIKNNPHHLGGNPQPYSHTIWRMNKMFRLVQILSRINKDVLDEEVNHEMKIYRDKT